MPRFSCVHFDLRQEFWLLAEILTIKRFPCQGLAELVPRCQKHGKWKDRNGKPFRMNSV
jgi:hypothetical protein